MKKLLMSLVVGLALTPNANAQTVSNFVNAVQAGHYRNSQFRIDKQGTTISLIDYVNNIRYNVDLSNTRAQSIPADYLEFLRRNKSTSSVASIVKNISIKGLRAGRAPGSGRPMMVGQLVIELEYSSAFGSLSATVESEASLIADVEEVGSYVYNPSTKSYNLRLNSGTVLRANTGARMQLTGLETSLGDSTTKIIGLVVDVGLRIGSLGLQTLDTLKQTL